MALMSMSSWGSMNRAPAGGGGGGGLRLFFQLSHAHAMLISSTFIFHCRAQDSPSLFTYHESNFIANSKAHISEQDLSVAIELYHAMLKQKILPVLPLISKRLDGQKQSFLFSWDSKWLLCDKGLCCPFCP